MLFQWKKKEFTKYYNLSSLMSISYSMLRNKDFFPPCYIYLSFQVGSLYVGGEEFSLQPIDQGARRKRQVSIKIGKDGQRTTSVMYGLFKKKMPKKGVNWEMNKKTKDFKKAWQESRSQRKKVTLMLKVDV